MSMSNTYISAVPFVALEVTTIEQSKLESTRHQINFNTLPPHPYNKKPFTMPTQWVEKHKLRTGSMVLFYDTGYISACNKEIFLRDNVKISSAEAIAHFNRIINKSVCWETSNIDLLGEQIYLAINNTGVESITSLHLTKIVFFNLYQIDISDSLWYREKFKLLDTTTIPDQTIVSIINSLKETKVTKVWVEGDVLIGGTELGSIVELGSYSTFKTIVTYLEAKK